MLSSDRATTRFQGRVQFLLQLALCWSSDERLRLSAACLSAVLRCILHAEKVMLAIAVSSSMCIRCFVSSAHEDGCGMC